MDDNHQINADEDRDVLSDIRLDDVYPWGRSFDEYCRMFSLRSVDLAGRILGCSDGPASFNAELTKRGGRVVSVDPVYGFSCEQIAARIDAARPTILENTRRTKAAYRWDAIASIEALDALRSSAMQRFLSDFESGRATGRYVRGALPTLPFPGGSFDLALCSHFLFTYSHVFDAEFHAACLIEMARVAREVRVFPLLTMNGEVSPHLDSTTEIVERAGLRVERVAVRYEFQKGSNEMLRVTSFNKRS